jgi:hypothetical protein
MAIITYANAIALYPTQRMPTRRGEQPLKSLFETDIWPRICARMPVVTSPFLRILGGAVFDRVNS